MKRFIEGEARTQVTLLPECLDDYVTEENPVRVVDVFVDELDLGALGFEGVDPAATGRPAYHPAVLLKIYIYGYLNRIQSSRRLEREAERNVELMWLTGRLAPDFKTIADFRKDNGKAIRSVCRQFVVLCRNLNLFSQSIIAIDGSKFKAVNNRDRNFTQGKVKARMQQIEQSIDRYLAAMDSADRATPEVAEAKAERHKEKIETLKKQMQTLKDIEAQLHESPDQQISLTDPDARSMATSGRGTGTVGYNVQTAVDDKYHLIVAHDHIIAVPQMQLPNAVIRNEQGLQAAGVESGEDEPRRITQLRKLREVPYSELIALDQFIDGHTPFATKHGVKGAEFENVIVVLGRGWNQYNFAEMIEWFQPGPPANRREKFESNRNLFYVACSRPKVRLALLFTQLLSQAALAQITAWFGAEHVFELPADPG
jgi:transposase